MKFTLSRINKKNKLSVSYKSLDTLMERIAKDDAKQSIMHFRQSVPLMNGDYQYYHGIKQWQHIYTAALFDKDASDNLVFLQLTGLVQLTFCPLTTPQTIDAAKKAVSVLPMTYAALEGADGRSMVVLVSVTDENGKLPDAEAAAEKFYYAAYEQVKNIYQPIVGAAIQPEEPGLHANMLLTLDASPYLAPKAVAMRIQHQTALHPAPQNIDDLKAYKDNEYLYRKAVEATRMEMKKADVKWRDEEDRLFAGVSALAGKLRQMGLGEEETFIHIRRNHWSSIPEETLRQIVGAAFDTDKEVAPASNHAESKGRKNILQMMHFLKSRYVFRYNAVMKYTEYRPNNSWIGDFKPVDARVQKRMTLEVQLEDIRVSIKDVRNFLESDYIKNYNPIETFLYDCLGKWDGKDRIRALARTVPNNNPHWEDWFYTWFLGMVDQWRVLYRRQYGNSTVPLLISEQGYNKSTFCRRLIPDTLQWGYNDNLILSEKRQVLQGMSQFLLINLDEFNQISPKVQQGFLKNLLQLAAVKIKPPYGTHVQEFPRLASFIATSNMTDILADPSGNRRFLAVELTGPIDVSGRLNYVQLYAQAMQALENGEKTYFDAEETKVIMRSNEQFQVASPIKQCFLATFEPTNDKEKGEFMTAASIFGILKAKYGASLQINSLQMFGRELRHIEGLIGKRTAQGTEYLVINKQKT